MSYYMNGSPQKPERQTRFTAIRPPDKAFVFLDEHENSISGGVFFVHVPGDEGEQHGPTNNPAFGGAHWMSVPADRHGQGCSLAFADGHGEHWKWLWPKQVSDDESGPVNDLDFQDLRRLQGGIPEP